MGKHIQQIIFVILAVMLQACASTRPKNASDYDTDLSVPLETDQLIFLGKKIFDEPMGGVMLRYGDRSNLSDIITVYVYPISQLNWTDVNATLEQEMDAVLAEVDYVVKVGGYRSRSNAERTDFVFDHEQTSYVGKKAQFRFVHGNGDSYNSYAYLFLSGDKYIKFRTSFNELDSPDWSGDLVVKGLLPDIKVPPESQYMKDLRAESAAKWLLEALNGSANRP